MQFCQRSRSAGGVFVPTRRTGHTHRTNQAAGGTDGQSAFHDDEAVDVIELGANVATRRAELGRIHPRHDGHAGFALGDFEGVARRQAVAQRDLHVARAIEHDGRHAVAVLAAGFDRGHGDIAREFQADLLDRQHIGLGGVDGKGCDEHRNPKQ